MAFGSGAATALLGGQELLAKRCHLSAEGVVASARVLILHSLILDHLCALRELEGGQSLAEVMVGGRDGGDEHSLGVAAQGVAEQEGELGVAVVDVAEAARGLLHQRVDYLTQCGEGLVDVGGFLQPLSTRLRRLKSTIYDRQADSVNSL